jgi:D-beta-D-heptose 7-phosphate kinase/D-beta-D-heptose 1-phosphate adenosyltransferase
MKHRIVLVTGGFDPLHSGHIAYFKEAKKLGSKLVVGLNSDEWLTRKKGRPFLTIDERRTIVEALELVDSVITFDDSNGSANLAIYK